jgi:hypothetical protein
LSSAAEQAHATRPLRAAAERFDVDDNTPPRPQRRRGLAPAVSKKHGLIVDLERHDLTGLVADVQILAVHVDNRASKLPDRQPSCLDAVRARRKCDTRRQRDHGPCETCRPGHALSGAVAR